MTLHWYILRIKESRGFISRRILQKVVTWQTSVYGQSYSIYYGGGFYKVLSIEEIFKIPEGKIKK